jgi:excinuclease ABC subunit C
MREHSGIQEYEQAGALRDRIAAIERTTERQRVHTHDGDDRDVIVLERAGGHLAFTVFVYRNGLLLATRPYVLKDHDRETGDVMNEFIHRYYEREAPPREILVDVDVDEQDLLEEWLGERRDGRCEVLRPQRGDKVRLLEIAHENCQRLLEQHLTGRESLEAIHAEIMKKFHLTRVPDPIECYDISTLGGYATVGSLVTFRRGESDKARYRIFKIKSFEGQDDFGSLREVLTRRFRKAMEKEEVLPGLVLIDGGKGQLAVADEVFQELGITDVGLVSIAKSRLKELDALAHHDWREKAGEGGPGREIDAPPEPAEVATEASPEVVPDASTGASIHASRGRGRKKEPEKRTKERTQERFFLPGRKNPVTFPSGSPALYLLQRARDEAHRFGITAHRKQRRRRNLRSSLEDLPGVGKGRARQLLKAFGSVKSLREASEEDIAATPGIPKTVAATVHEYLHEAPVEDPGLEIPVSENGG